MGLDEEHAGDVLGEKGVGKEEHQHATNGVDLKRQEQGARDHDELDPRCSFGRRIDRQNLNTTAR